jgi:ferritin-like metal-binding protein YciE
MELQTLHDLLILQIKDLYSAEKQLVEALPRMAMAANSESLREGFEKHLEETQNQVERLEKIGENLGFAVGGHGCKGMQGLIEEGKELMTNGGDSTVIDSGLIGAAQKVEHYEIAGYGTAIELAKLMAHDNAVKLLEESLEEEKETDKKLSKLAESEVNVNAKRM